MSLLRSKHSRGCVPSAPCRGRKHGREMVWIIIGQKSTHSTTLPEGGRSRELTGAGLGGRGTSPNPITTPSPPLPQERHKRKCAYVYTHNKNRAGFSWTLTPPSEPSMPPPPATRAGTNSNRTATTDAPPRLPKSPPRPELTLTWSSPFMWAWLELKTSLRDHTKLPFRVHHPSENSSTAHNTGSRDYGFKTLGGS